MSHVQVPTPLSEIPTMGIVELILGYKRNPPDIKNPFWWEAGKQPLFETLCIRDQERWVPEQMVRSGGQYDAKPQCLVPKQPWPDPRLIDLGLPRI
ncbi:hypothetical protein TNCV_286661 [Trichonephila clavipes]|nr:hypothetical protein TNCV_286661 [Trichonephila clavipes]